MCFLKNWTTTEILTLLYVILTAGILCFAYLAYKKILVQEASKEQLKIVNELVNNVIFSGVMLRWKHFSASPFRFNLRYNLFEFGSINLFKEAENLPVHLTRDVLIKDLNPVWKHLGNPLLPTQIANRLIELRKICEVKWEDENQANNPHYILGEDNGLIQGEVVTTEFQPRDGINGWLNACNNFRTSVIKWYDKKGVKDINLSTFQLHLISI